MNRKCKESRKVQIKKLNELIFMASTNLKMAVIVSDTSIKNQIASSITHIYVHNKPVIKTFYYAVNVTSTKVELFAIRCGINQAI